MKKLLEQRIDQAAKREDADLVLKNATLFNLVDGSHTQTDIAICNDTIVGTYGNYTGKREIDAGGFFAVPGFVDTHLHIESSLVTPGEFERCVLPKGTTTAICDPHEIANVLGKDGIQYFLDAAANMIMDLRVQLSSCVPATNLETAGASLSGEDLLPFLSHPKVIGLAEFMNFPGVIHKDPQVMDKLEKFYGEHIDGHCPLLRGIPLNAYLASGIQTDHESTELDEAQEKLLKGMRVLIREGSVTKDLQKLAPLLNDETSPFICFCTDDRNFMEIVEDGHINYMVRKAIKLGVSPLNAYRAASWSACQTFGLKAKGLIAPGYKADILLLKNLEDCTIHQVFCGGKLVGDSLFSERKLPKLIGLKSVKNKKLLPADFDTPVSNPSVPVIEIIPGKVITGFSSETIPVNNGLGDVSLDKDIVKICVIERHGKNGNIAHGFCKGFGLTNGALASSVGHDSHNVCVIGTNNQDMALAANRLRETQGGYVAVQDGKIQADFAMPLAGLMSIEAWENISESLSALHKAVKQMEFKPEEPFQHLAFMPLSVIPHLKITDMGLVDVDKFEFVSI